MSGNKLPDAQAAFRLVLQGLVIVVSSDEEAKEVCRAQKLQYFLQLDLGSSQRNIVTAAREYLLGVTIELQ